MKKAALSLIMSVALIGTSSFAKDKTSISYVSHSGNAFIVIDPVGHSVSFQGTADPNDRGDLGGSYSDCSNQSFLCVTWGSSEIAVPRVGDLPPEWTVMGSQFRVVGTLAGGDHKVWLVSVTDKGDTWLNFSYSRERGIESLSTQVDEQPKFLAVTYFLMNRQGLLSVS